MGERSLAEEWEAQAEAWARWVRTPGHDHHFHRYNWPAFIELVPKAGRATLDLGCGEGRAGGVLRQGGHRVIGVDSSPSLVKLAADTGAYEEVVLADAAALPFPDSRFDLVIAFMSLQDMDDAAGAIQETARVLAPGGRMVAALVHPFASAELGHEPGGQRGYFELRRTLNVVERDGIEFAFHQVHRPLQGWLRLFLDAGFWLEALAEPRPSTADVAEEPRLAEARRQPAFLHLRWRR